MLLSWQAVGLPCNPQGSAHQSPWKDFVLPDKVVFFSTKMDFARFCANSSHLPPPLPRGPVLLARRWVNSFLTGHSHLLPHWINISPVSQLPCLWSCSCLYLEFPLHHSPSPHVTSKREGHQLNHKAELKYHLFESVMVVICLSEAAQKRIARYSPCHQRFPALISTWASGWQASRSWMGHSFCNQLPATSQTWGQTIF